jgi:thioredoxin-related protein
MRGAVFKEKAVSWDNGVRFLRHMHVALAMLAGGVILACGLCAPARAQQHLAEPADLRASATRAAAEGRAVLVLFAEAGCPFCERLRRDYLLPLQRNAEYGRKVAFFEVDVHATKPLRDFAGVEVTQAQLARRYGIRIMPTVLLLGPDGRPLAEPLVGYQSSDFYGAYLDQRIDTALAALQSGRGSTAK